MDLLETRPAVRQLGTGADEQLFVKQVKCSMMMFKVILSSSCSPGTLLPCSLLTGLFRAEGRARLFG